MCGAYRVKIKSKRAQEVVEYSLDIERNITIIRGNSGTGKSYLVSLLSDFMRDRPEHACEVQVFNDADECVYNSKGISDYREAMVLTADDLYYKEGIFDKYKNKIYFTDEESRFYYKSGFLARLKRNGSYIVIVVRDEKRLDMLPFAVSSILQLVEKQPNQFVAQAVYGEYLKQYENLVSNPVSINKYSYIFREDAGAGFSLLKSSIENLVGSSGLSMPVGKASKLRTVLIWGKNNSITLDSLYGKGNILPALSIVEGSEPVLLEVDQAAFGSKMRIVVDLMTVMNITLVLPESFEWILLHIPDLQANAVLEFPTKYIESSKHKSWENFFFDYLVKATENLPITTYSKRTELPEWGKTAEVERILLKYYGLCNEGEKK